MYEKAAHVGIAKLPSCTRWRRTEARRVRTIQYKLTRTVRLVST